LSLMIAVEEALSEEDLEKEVYVPVRFSGTETRQS